MGKGLLIKVTGRFDERPRSDPLKNSAVEGAELSDGLVSRGGVRSSIVASLSGVEMPRTEPMPGTFTPDQSAQLGWVLSCSSVLSLVGAGVILGSILKFRELSKRFFAIRLIFCLALTNASAAAFHLFGAVLRTGEHSARELPCQLQAFGVLYSELASILWTSCFALTLFRDVVPSYRRHALRRYEVSFHFFCWPLPALLAGLAVWLGGADGGTGEGGWAPTGPASPYPPPLSPSAFSPAFSLEQLALDVPLLIAYVYNALTYLMVWSWAREWRLSRSTSLYLLAFLFVWLPSLAIRLHVLLAPGAPLPFWLPLAAAFCTPIQGALNAAVYALSLLTIRDIYRTMLLGTAMLDVSPQEVGGGGGAPRGAAGGACGGWFGGGLGGGGYFGGDGSPGSVSPVSVHSDYSPPNDPKQLLERIARLETPGAEGATPLLRGGGGGGGHFGGSGQHSPAEANRLFGGYLGGGMPGSRSPASAASNEGR